MAQDWGEGGSSNAREQVGRKETGLKGESKTETASPVILGGGDMKWAENDMYYIT